MSPSPAPLTSHLLYLHGFRSSPQSAKAVQVAARVREQHPGVVWRCPQLPASPSEAARLIRHLTEDWPREGMAVIGSSLGGFYARWLSLQRDLAKYIGEHPVWQNPDEHIFFRAEFVDELTSLAGDIDRLAPRNPATPDRLFALVSEKDEVLDLQEMLAFCAGGTVRRLPEGDHAISDFDQHIDDLFGFLWPPRSAAARVAAPRGG